MGRLRNVFRLESVQRKEELSIRGRTLIVGANFGPSNIYRNDIENKNEFPWETTETYCSDHNFIDQILQKYGFHLRY